MKDSRHNKKEDVVRDLKQRVLSVELPPGSALDEAQLSAQYGLSRTPLREVFQRLAGEGFVNIETNRGASVTSMDFATMRTFFQCAPMVYAAVARLATEQATPAQIDELKNIQQKFRHAFKQADSQSMSLWNHQFHEQLGFMSASPYLTPSLGRLLIDHTRMSHRFYRTDNTAAQARVAQACDQHDQMIDAIASRLPAESVELTLQHWELSRNEIDKYVLPDPLPLDATPSGAIPADATPMVATDVAADVS